ncbi:hypothetical protein PIB30_021692 [Stylosanthes scabra]|uniref:Uncharacterized protein n=1 Tax=Stylosanthes scabra TaxID=79078 RepID=A0ABU6QA01_9FABA|nr:hypothetical protein [Stylosanthes scabra]
MVRGLAENRWIAVKSRWKTANGVGNKGVVGGEEREDDETSLTCYSLPLHTLSHLASQSCRALSFSRSVVASLITLSSSSPLKQHHDSHISLASSPFPPSQCRCLHNNTFASSWRPHFAHLPLWKRHRVLHPLCLFESSYQSGPVYLE